MPQAQSRYIVEKGSIAVDGISLTVNSCAAGQFSVSIIPHTVKMTTLGSLKVGQSVNIEVDIIGKYVEKLLGAQIQPSAIDECGPGIDTAFLAEHGFFR